MSRGLAALFALSLLTFAGCAEQGMVDDASGAISERNDYKRAKAAGTSSAWSGFIEHYPQSTSRPKAEAERDDAIWRETEQTNTAAAYLSFTQSKPSHRMAGESRDRCRKLLEDGQGGESDYIDYLRAYPSDPSARALRQALKGVRFASIQRSANPDVYALFAAQYPGTPEAAKLLPDVQKQAFQDAEKVGTRLAYQFFVKRYPAAPDTPKAQAKLAHFGAPETQQGNPGDLKKLLPQLRRASTALAERECRKGLALRLKRLPDLYGAEAEEIRDHLRELRSSGGTPGYCSELAMTVPPVGRQTAANAVRALAVLMERQQYLAAVLSSPDKIASNAQQVSDQADTLADSSESGELEIEALYGNMPADPKKPDETASKNAHEAARRAKRARELVQGMSKKEEIAEILDAAKRQTDLLVEILASVERPAGLERVARAAAVAEQPADSSADAPAAEEPAPAPAREAEQARPDAPAASGQVSEDLAP